MDNCRTLNAWEVALRLSRLKELLATAELVDQRHFEKAVGMAASLLGSLGASSKVGGGTKRVHERIFIELFLTLI